MMKKKATALAAILALLLTAIAATSMPAAADEIKETDDDHVDIVSPDGNSEVAGMVTFTVEVWACFCDGKTTLYIDDEFVSEGENQGSETRGDEVFEIFTHEWDSATVEDGEYLVVAYGKHGEGYDKMSIVVDNDPADDDGGEEPAPDDNPAPPDDQLVDEPDLEPVDEPADDGGDSGSDDGGRDGDDPDDGGDDTVTVNADDGGGVVVTDVDADEGGTTDSGSDGATEGPKEGEEVDGDDTVDHQNGGDGGDEPAGGDTIGIDDGLPGGESPEKEANSADTKDKAEEEADITYMLGLVLVAASVVILLVVLVRRND
jgi:hypothetical protein